MTRTRRIILVILVIFVLYAIINSPEQAASYVQDAFRLLADAVQNVFKFFNSLLA